ncbi:D-Ala-D-Ala carboxypeptidase family metallohydrolase [Halomonas korlensis]|uniref:Peptidase M15 n=1 Tax=Halomonas korlensis TaxID=463301 RepID=A0A1I7J532_9GAMM|nr:D-Ala-D-Ala carboxypeptidase family metallohydrolase [Halomonas korlensis]SFU80232.1 Peptidase M15 [Halomonas korlensis]
MTRLSPHFTRAEFACRCGCGFDTVDVETLAILERLRTHFDQPVTVTSGCRCSSHNARIGGVPGSQHTLGRAADIQVRGVPAPSVYAWLAENHPSASLGRYANFIHIDTRQNGPARWQA